MVLEVQLSYSHIPALATVTWVWGKAKEWVLIYINVSVYVVHGIKLTAFSDNGLKVNSLLR